MGRTGAMGVVLEVIGDDRCAGFDDAAEEGVQVVEFHADGGVLGVEVPRHVVPEVARYRLDLEIGQVFLSLLEFGNQAEFALGQVQEGVQQIDENRLGRHIRQKARLGQAAGRQKFAEREQLFFRPASGAGIA